MVQPVEEEVIVGVAGVTLAGTLAVPAGAGGLVIFAHGSGSSRRSPRNRAVAETLRHAGLATLLLDLLTADEEAVDRRTREYRFDVELLARRLVEATDWAAGAAATRGLPVGYFGASTGAGAALIAAARRPETVAAVVSRGGRPDLAGNALQGVRASVLLIVGGDDTPVIGLNREALARLPSHARLRIVPGATHLFEEPGALDAVARMAADWFVRHLRAGEASPGTVGHADVGVVPAASGRDRPSCPDRRPVPLPPRFGFSAARRSSRCHWPVAKSAETTTTRPSRWFCRARRTRSIPSSARSRLWRRGVRAAACA
jgi:dienelactone hydrolase